MPYEANQYNYATPLSSATDFNNSASAVVDRKYFTLHGNVLDGTYFPISGDVGLWGATLSDNDGYLDEPFTVVIEDVRSVRALSITGSEYNYPVDFTVSLFNGSETLHTVTITGNTSKTRAIYFPTVLDVTRYSISISRISASNAVAVLHTVYPTDHIANTDSTVLATTERTTLTINTTSWLQHNDSAAIRCVEASHIVNVIDRTVDRVAVAAAPHSEIINVHTKMKEPSRRIYGKVYITYADPMLDSETAVSTNMEAYNSNKEQTIDGVYAADTSLFTLYDNALDGSFKVMTALSQVGWVSGGVSDEYGYFSEAPYLRIDFSARVVLPLTVHFDDSRGCVAEEFTVEFVQNDGTSVVETVTGNTSAIVHVNNDTILAKAVIISVLKVTKPNFPVVILEVPVTSTILYRGYQDVSDLVSIDILEELTYDDEIEALGGVSANEATIVLDNSNGDFYFNNDKSAISKMLRRNRKIEPWLGVEIKPGEIEWYKQGTYWSYRWNVPVGNLTATVLGFDTIGLLGSTTFEEHHMYVDKSLGELIDIVLTDAKKQLSFIAWKVDAALYDIVVPFAWFEPSNHAAALRKISQSYPMHIYCDKDGNICAAPQKLHLEYFYDTWSDSTNVMSKQYNSLYTALPNVVNVTVCIPHESTGAELVNDTLPFNVASVTTRKLKFNKPYISDIVVTMDKDSTVNYSYAVYSWGIEFTFGGTGNVRSIKCVGTALDVSNTAVLTQRDDDSIRLNGAIPRDVQSDFIQTSTIAQLILDRIFSLSATDKYDVSVTYRGDIALSINDPIILLDGIAPDNRYNLRRNQLFWNGTLTGTADLNT